MWFPLETDCAIWLPWGLLPSRSGKSLGDVVFACSPKTDMKEGIGMNDLELA
jgi:hypothetical protein